MIIVETKLEDSYPTSQVLSMDSLCLSEEIDIGLGEAFYRWIHYAFQKK